MSGTDAVFARLPSAIRVAPGSSSPLNSLIGALGSELPKAENALAAVMRAHWADLADAGEALPDDLRRIAALYGLAAADDESAEDFREHLKRYVRTFLEGAATVPGVLSVTAQALGLRIDDPRTGLDAWWRRPEPLVLTEPSEFDAAWPLFGGHPRASRSAAAPARLTGPALPRGVDLRAARTLTLTVDGGPPVTVDLADGAADPAAVPPGHLAERIDQELGQRLATVDADGRLVITSPSTGAGSRLELRPGTGDAAQAVLGVLPRIRVGAAATGAVITGAIPLPARLDPARTRYLRLAVDGGPVAEIDLADADLSRAVGPAGVVAAIGAVFSGLADLTPDQRLTLRSPGSLRIPPAPAQDAAALLGGVPSFASGNAERPARLPGTAVLGAAVDLRAARLLRIALDGGKPVDIDVRGAEPSATTPAEIVSRINTAAGAPLAVFDGRTITLTSPLPGPASRIEIGEPPADAAAAVLGLRPLTAAGADAGPAELVGRPIPGPVDLTRRHLLAVRVGDGPAGVYDLRPEGVADPAAVPPEALALRLNARAGTAIAAVLDGALVLRAGTEASVAVEPLGTTSSRRFVSRIAITDDAAVPLLGRSRSEAAATPARPAEVAGCDHPAGTVDLRAARHLRIAVDDGPPVDVDCAGRRPRVTTPAEVAAAVNSLVPGGVASTAGNRIVLRAAARITFGAPRADDALAAVAGGTPRTARGTDPTGVHFAGLPDLSGGVTLPAGAALALGVDGAEPVEVVVGDVTASSRTLAQLVFAVNAALPARVATHDGKRLLLASPTSGAAAGLTFAVPAGGRDATETLLGVPAPRTYAGTDGSGARLTGGVALPQQVDLSGGRLLRFAVDGGVPLQADLAGDTGDPAVTPRQRILDAVDAAADREVAALDGDRLVLASPTTGSASRVELLPALAPDARGVLFGDVPDVVEGVPAAPAVLTGDVTLDRPVDLSRGSLLRLTVDGAKPVDVDVCGPVRAATTLADVVAAVEAVVPGLAAATPDGRLALHGRESVIAGSPRHLEVAEYPAVLREVSAPVRHAARIPLLNAGVLAAPLTAEVTAPCGLVGPGLADPEQRWAVRVLDVVAPGERVRFVGDEQGGVQVLIGPPGAAGRPVPAGALRIGTPPPAVAAAWPAGERPGPLRAATGPARPVFLECRADRFDGCSFGAARFAGGRWSEDAVFGVSRFEGEPLAVFAAAAEDHGAGAALSWQAHEPGSFEVNLPLALDRRYGGRFGLARFGGPDPHGPFTGLAVDPPEDEDDHLVAVLASRSALVTAAFTDELPIGAVAVPLPTPGPVPLRLGRGDRSAAVHLSHEGFGGRFVRIGARVPGPDGETLTFAAEPDGPGTFAVSVACTGDCFESARTAAAGNGAGPGSVLPEQALALAAPARVGVLSARAAGINVRVTRDPSTRPRESTP